MSTPTIRTDGPPTVTSGATVAEAQLVVQILANGTASGAARGFELLRSADSPMTLEQLRDAHPRLGDDYRQVMAFLEECETIATFVKHGLLNEAFINDLFWVAGGWAACAEVCRGMREESGEPRLYENFEWLASRAT
jgi:Domain of unknown function (DUF4760)